MLQKQEISSGVMSHLACMQTRPFTFTLPQQVQKVHIGHDSKGRNKGVFVEEIEVTAPDAPKVIFPCRCWLAENEDDGKTARVIVPGESLTQPYDGK